MNKTKTAVIGVGHMGNQHARVYAELENSQLVGVYDLDREVGRRIALQHGTKLFDSIPELIEASEAVSIAVPTSSHFDVAAQCILAGRHLLLEKPMTNTTEEAVKLVEMAKKAGVVLQVGHIERFNPILQALEERLTNPHFIEAHRLSPYPGRSTDIGVVMDLMIHDLEIILHLVKSPIKNIDAVGIAVLSKGEDIANARIRFENGCVANITTSRISPEKMRKIRVFQDDAYLSLDYQNQAGEVYRKVRSQITREAIPIAKEEPLKRQLSAFIEAAQTHSTPVVSGEQAAGALEVAAQIIAEIAKSPFHSVPA